MDKKKLIAIFLVILISSSPLILASKLDIIDDDFSKDVNKSNSFIINGIEYKYNLSWSKINSSGKGFHIIYALKVLKFNAPIPTPQYHNFFPFKIDLFFTWCRYWDQNATTVITPVNGEKNHTITGDHSFFIVFLKIPAMNLLRQLLKDGILDGLQGWQQKFGDLSFAGFLRHIRNSLIGGPIKWVKNETLDFLKTLSGVVPRYDNWYTPILNIPPFKEKIEDFQNSDTLLSNLTTEFILTKLRYLFFMLLPGMFWNRSPIRMSFLHPIIPQKLLGYTPFVIWCENPPKLIPRI